MVRLLYPIYFVLIAAPLFLVLTVLTALTTTAGCLLGGERIFSYYPGMLWSRLACLLVLCPVHVRGREHLRRGCSYVFAANHQGAFDIFLIYGFLGLPIKWMMKAGLGRIPLVGYACRAAGFIFVDNSSPRAARRSIAEAEQRVKDGFSLAVFPEGSRSQTGRMGRFKKGAFQVAFDRGLPVVPITLNGPYHVLPIGAWLPWPHRLERVIHPPIDSKAPAAEEGVDEFACMQQVADRTRAAIASALWKEFR